MILVVVYRQFQCPSGLSPMIDDNHHNDVPKSCNPMYANSCANDSNAYCIFDQVYGNYQCCRRIESITFEGIALF
jgi:hypothetical protein